MTEINPNIEWNPRLELYFAQTGEKAQSLSWLHKTAQQRYSNMKNYTDLPVIILGVLNGATSIGSQSLFGDSQFASVGIGIIALVTAILSTISSYFKWAARAEAHRIASLQYSKLYRFLYVQCSLPRNERMSPSELLKYTKDEYDRMSEIAPLLPPEVVDAFKSKFNKPEYASISKPEEANGLEAIIPYKPSEYPSHIMPQTVQELKALTDRQIFKPSEVIVHEGVTAKPTLKSPGNFEKKEEKPEQKTE
jgi:hypothetical protein